MPVAVVFAEDFATHVAEVRAGFRDQSVRWWPLLEGSLTCLDSAFSDSEPIAVPQPRDGGENLCVITPVVDSQQRSVLVNRLGTSILVADHYAQLELLAAEFASQDRECGVLVQIATGGRYCGMAPGADAARLAKVAESTPGLRFAGIFADACHLALAKLPGVSSAFDRARQALDHDGIEWPQCVLKLEDAWQSAADCPAADVVIVDILAIPSLRRNLWWECTVLRRASLDTASIDLGRSVVSATAQLRLEDGSRADVVSQTGSECFLRLDESARNIAIGDRIRVAIVER